MKQLTSREKLLAGAIGGILFLLINLFLLSHFIHSQADLRRLAVEKANNLQMMETLCKSRDMWTKRDQWLGQKQPKLANESSAGVQLLDYLKDNAKKSEVTLENPAIGTPTKSPSAISVPVSVETKSSWESLIRFLNSVHQPDQFIVFESANLQIDATDQSQMRGKFKIARWYAPK